MSLKLSTFLDFFYVKNELSCVVKALKIMILSRYRCRPPTVFGPPLPNVTDLDQRYSRLPCVTDRAPTLPRLTLKLQALQKHTYVTQRYRKIHTEFMDLNLNEVLNKKR